MKTKLLLSIAFLILISYSIYSQMIVNEKLTLLREVINSSLVIYKNDNWNKSFKPGLYDLGYDLVDMSIDTSKVYPIIRKVITPKYYSKLNKEKWRICTILTSSGKIVSVSFWFKDDSGVDINEFTILAEQIRNNITWNLSFNKKVADLFYLTFNFPGPKL